MTDIGKWNIGFVMSVAQLQSEKLSWNDVKSTIKNLNSSFYEIIESDPSLIPEYVVLLRYPYGYDVISQGQFNTNNPDIVDFEPSFCLVNQGCFEQNIIVNSMIKTMGQFLPGDFFYCDGVLGCRNDNSRLYTPRHMLNISSGVRNAFVSQISLAGMDAAVKMSRKYGRDYRATDNAYDQFSNFKLIAAERSPKWHTSAFAFPSSWEKRLNLEIQQFFMEDDFKKIHPVYKDDTKTILTFVESKANASLSLFEKDIIRHLIFIALGGTYAIQASIDESYAPIKSIQEALIYDYGLKNIPIFFKATKMSNKLGDEPVYFSMRNHINFLPQPSMLSTTVKLMDNLCRGLEIYSDFMKDWDVIREGTSLKYLANYFKSRTIHPTKADFSQILALDPNFVEQIKRFPKLNYEKPGKLLSGCLQLRYED